MTYKKRAKAGWEVGKENKEKSNRSERNYIKNKIKRARYDSSDGSDTERIILKSEIQHEENVRDPWEEPEEVPKVDQEKKRYRAKLVKLEKEIRKTESSLKRNKRSLARYGGEEWDYLYRYTGLVKDHIKRDEAKLLKLNERLNKHKIKLD